MAEKCLQWMRSGQLLLVAFILLPVAGVSADDQASAYTTYWQGELAKTTAPLTAKRPANQPPASTEQVKKDVETLRLKMNNEREQMKRLAQQYLATKQNHEKIMQQQTALSAVADFRSSFGNKSPEQYSAAVKNYAAKYLPNVTDVHCGIQESWVPFSHPVECALTMKDGQKKTVDLDQWLKDEGTALKGQMVGAELATHANKLQQLAHTELDAQLIQQLAEGKFDQLGSLDQMLSSGDLSKIDQQAKEALNRFVSDLFINQKAMSTLSRKLAELTTNFKDNEQSLADFLAQLDNNIAQTTIGNFVERTAFGVACSVKEQPDMCGGNAGGNLSEKINNARKKYGKALFPPALQAQPTGAPATTKQ